MVLDYISVLFNEVVLVVLDYISVSFNEVVLVVLDTSGTAFCFGLTGLASSVKLNSYGTHSGM